MCTWRMVALDLDFFSLINATKEVIQSGFLALHNGKARCSARAPAWRHGGRAGEEWRVRLGGRRGRGRGGRRARTLIHVRSRAQR